MLDHESHHTLNLAQSRTLLRCTSHCRQVAFLFYCRWGDIGNGKAMHYVFTDQSCIDMPHLAHMAFGGVVILLLAAMTLALVSSLRAIELLALAEPLHILWLGANGGRGGGACWNELAAT